MQTRESRPATNEAANEVPTTVTSVTAVTDVTWSIPRGLRARRAASLRLPVLWCGHHRDPLEHTDCCAGPCTTSDSSDELDWDEGDRWHDSWADRGIPERETRGRELATAGWVA